MGFLLMSVELISYVVAYICALLAVTFFFTLLEQIFLDIFNYRKGQIQEVYKMS